ncbi:IclR family transcriptional regulator [Nocardia sp. NPDC059239]|uniref:IclR family transcriptional regulator n=1 Tax=unclassified Nocardia TaxID=2637762 RepID=UPI0036A377E9
MTLILDLFDDPSVWMPLGEIASRTGLPRSSSYRILEHLSVLGWLRRRPSGYGLGPRALRLGVTRGTDEELRITARPALEELHAHTGATAYLGILDFDEVVFVDRVTRLGSGAGVGLGHRAPAYATALGKALLAAIGPEQAGKALAAGLRPCTPKTITSRRALYAELRRIHSGGGLAFDSGEYLRGFDGVAAVIHGADGVRGAIGVSAPGTGANLRKFASLVIGAAQRVSLQLDPSGITTPRPATARNSPRGAHAVTSPVDSHESPGSSLAGRRNTA